MPRPICLFTGQWADLPLEVLAKKAKDFGYDGLELACWGDHFDVARCNQDKDWAKKHWAVLQDHGLGCFALSTHLVGQAVCDRIDERHKAILPAQIWGDGKSEGVQQRAAREVIETGKAARKFFDAAPAAVKERLKQTGRTVVNGFTGSSIWHLVYSFPPVSKDMLEAGYRDFAARWTPILEEFKKVAVSFALEVHPTEIAFDIVSAQRAPGTLLHSTRTSPDRSMSMQKACCAFPSRGKRLSSPYNSITRSWLSPRTAARMSASSKRQSRPWRAASAVAYSMLAGAKSMPTHL